MCAYNLQCFTGHLQYTNDNAQYEDAVSGKNF